MTSSEKTNLDIFMIVLQFFLVIFSLVVAVLLGFGTFQSLVHRKCPLGGFLLSLAAVTISHTVFIQIWHLEGQMNEDRMTKARGKFCRFLDAMARCVDSTTFFLLVFLFIYTIVAANSPNKHKQQSSQRFFWSLLVFTWTGPLLTELTISFSFGKLFDNDSCYVVFLRQLAFAMSIFHLWIPSFVMLILTVMSSLIYHKVGRRQAESLEKQRLLSSCIGAGLYTFVEIITLVDYELYIYMINNEKFMFLLYLERVLIELRPAAICLFFLLICSDTRRKVFCRPTPSAQEVELSSTSSIKTDCDYAENDVL